ncbi:MAG: dTDP-4-dehydrorhamnose reductase, partial [Victivallaceae bacterium]|nr:dTDP-4-dehydrorhamnose reductase [Victivallaceae bacterium]
MKNNRKKLAVIGNGMLGYDVTRAAENSGWQVSVHDLPEFDLTDEKRFEQALGGADCIVNCAAYTNVDKAESEEPLCMAVNAEAPGKLGNFAAAGGKYLIHISTDFVFGDLTDAPQKESDPTNPLSVYGKSKLLGEEKLRVSGCRCGIIRVQWSYGINGNNFITKILELAKNLPKLKVVDDQTGAPTCNRDMARAVMDFLDNRIEGLYHFAASGYTTRFETAGEIIRHFKLNTELTPCKSGEFPAPAVRPHNSQFD